MRCYMARGDMTKKVDADGKYDVKKQEDINMMIVWVVKI